MSFNISQRWLSSQSVTQTEEHSARDMQNNPGPQELLMCMLFLLRSRASAPNSQAQSVLLQRRNGIPQNGPFLQCSSPFLVQVKALQGVIGHSLLPLLGSLERLSSEGC